MFRTGNKCLIAGIVNATPDSFSDGGAYDPTERAGVQLRAGADWLDFGGESTRPGALCVPCDQEIARVVPVIARIHAAYPEAVISVDTRKAAVAQAAVAAGATVINDVSGLEFDPAMAEVAAATAATVILMHSRGNPDDMDSRRHTDYGSAGVTAAVLEFWERAVEKALAAGIARDRILVDPGFGFAKTAEQNWQLVEEFERLLEQDHAVYIGVSRKRFLGGDDPLARIVSGCRVGAELARRGAAVVRTHDVAELLRELERSG